MLFWTKRKSSLIKQGLNSRRTLPSTGYACNTCVKGMVRWMAMPCRASCVRFVRGRFRTAVAHIKGLKKRISLFHLFVSSSFRGPFKQYAGSLFYEVEGAV